ncbi:hypothetical protein [Caulobacter sp.]|uniref:hypothetical protein n=1 Tax=Caulobacter sp. TaxID=78 RepID=UPI003BB0F941
MRHVLSTLALTATLAAPLGTAHAQSLEDRLRTQLVSVTTQLQGAQGREATLTAQKTTAEKDRDAIKRRLDQVEAQLRAARRQAAGAPQADRRQAEALAQIQTETETLRTQNVRLAAENQALLAERDALKLDVSTRDDGLTFCRAKNVEAIQVAKDALQALSEVGFIDVLARKEPVTGLHRVRVQKLEQDLGDRLYGSRLDVTPRPSQPAAASTSP